MCRAAEASTLGGLVQELDDSVPGEAAPATAALRSVLLDVFNEHDYNKDGKVGCSCICTHAHGICMASALTLMQCAQSGPQGKPPTSCRRYLRYCRTLDRATNLLSENMYDMPSGLIRSVVDEEMRHLQRSATSACESTGHRPLLCRFLLFALSGATLRHPQGI